MAVNRLDTLVSGTTTAHSEKTTMLSGRRLLGDLTRQRLVAAKPSSSSWRRGTRTFHGSTSVLVDRTPSAQEAAIDHRHPSSEIVPGARHKYGSMGELTAPHSKATSWQASHNLDIQHVTQKALIYELTQQQTKTIEQVVPWFLENMPASYFDQIPEPFRMDHIKAIAAIKDANMDLYLNLKSHMPDGREGTIVICSIGRHANDTHSTAHW